MKLNESVDAQCPKCLAVRMVTENMKRWRPTFVTFNNLPKEKCYACKAKETTTEASGDGV
jgi:hypothetical protein